jgi:predicted DNA-binding protein (MmcQ/YjbR family)
MTSFSEIEDYILTKPNSVKEFPFGDKIAVYKVNGKMFALLEVDSKPPRLSLKCDPGLAIILRERYLTVMPGFHLNKMHWNTVICSGQVSEEELKDFINHSYNLVSGNK